MRSEEVPSRRGGLPSSRIGVHTRTTPLCPPIDPPTEDIASPISWRGCVGVGDTRRRDLVLAAHELAPEAIERGAAEVAVLGELPGDAIRLTVAGGDWSSLDELRSTLVRALVSDVRIHRGIVTLRLKLDVDGA